MKHLCNFGVARKVSGAQIANPHHAGKYAWTLDGETVGENLDLYVGSEDGIVAVGDGINNKFSPTELGIVRDSTENSTLAQKCMFADLSFYESEDVACHVYDTSLKHLILHHIHLCAGQLLCSVIADDSHTRSRKPSLGSYAEQKDGCTTYIFPTVFLGDKVFVGTQVGQSVTTVANPRAVFLNTFQVEVFYSCFGDRLVLKIAHPLCEHQLHAFLKAQLMRFVADTYIGFVGRGGMKPVALFYIENQNMVGVSIVVCTIDIFRVYIDSRNTIIHRDAQQVIDISNITVDTRYRTVVLNADSHTSTVGIGHCHKNNGQPFRVNAGTFSIEGLALVGCC